MFLKELYTGETAFMIGNGINVLNGEISWRHLLIEIADNLRIKFDVKGSKEISYPLIAEGILFGINESYDKDIIKFKKQISSSLSKLDPIYQPVAHLLRESKIKHVLTTNYDYNLEKAIDSKWTRSKSPNYKPFKYSLRRKHRSGRKTIWHIHGEIDNGHQATKRKYPESSILIGHEHYTDYTRIIHEHVKPNISPTSQNYRGLYSELESRSSNPIWVDFFFTHDIRIVGFGFNPNEFHLWWLLNFRARLKRKFSSIKNTIQYFYPSSEHDNIVSLLEVLEVECTSVRLVDENWTPLYERALAI